MSSEFSLLVVSNRLPFTVRREADGGVRRVPAAGGLVTAVAPVVIQTKGNILLLCFLKLNLNQREWYQYDLKRKLKSLAFFKEVVHSDMFNFIIVKCSFRGVDWMAGSRSTAWGPDPEPRSR